MAFSKFALLCIALSASVSALSTPHHLPRNAHHRAIARAAAPALVDIPVAPLKKRQVRKRCKPRPSSSAVLAPSSSSIAPAPSSSIEPPPPSPTTTAVQSSSTPIRLNEFTSSEKAEPTPVPKEETAAKEPAPSTSQPAPEPSPSPSPASNGGGGGGGGGTPFGSFLAGVQTGQGTFYATGLGSCGITNNDSQFIAAVSHLLYDSVPGYNGVNPNTNPICGKFVNAQFEGKSVSVQITDRCEGCAFGDLDFSPAAFNTIADPGRGRISGITWSLA
ncbi:RlpA-like double-psi beta-barrel-protein domain-containing protein-containing protein [Infundibulicybe gibba]|nr:RlpA-like double-psi beta-barrel-protein domain-containing protein-containing protein [Infundibulicybe gibba]